MVSTIAICIVLTPILLMTGLSAWVFTPLALAVIFAMAASFLLSRTLIPVLCYLLLPADIESRKNPRWAPEKLLLSVNQRVEHILESLRERHHALLVRLGHHGGVLALAALLLFGLGAVSALSLGREYFPQVDAGQLRLQVRLPSGTRLEETAAKLTEIQREIRKIIPPAELQTVYEQIGVPDAINLSLVDSTVVGSFEAEIMLQLRAPHARSQDYLVQIRQRIAERFPEVKLFERPPDATSRTLAGSAAAAFEVRIIGRDNAGNLALAREVEQQLRAGAGRGRRRPAPGARSARIPGTHRPHTRRATGTGCAAGQPRGAGDTGFGRHGLAGVLDRYRQRHRLHRAGAGAAGQHDQHRHAAQRAAAHRQRRTGGAAAQYRHGHAAQRAGQPGAHHAGADDQRAGQCAGHRSGHRSTTG